MKPLFANDVIVLPVNTSLIMGAGLAKEAARRYPELGQLQSKIYWTLDFKPGTAQACCRANKVFILAATKDNWRNPSQLAWVEALCGSGKGSIENALQDVDVGSIGIPALGCGLGGLSYNAVGPLVTDLATRLLNRGWDVTLYGPNKATHEVRETR